MKKYLAQVGLVLFSFAVIVGTVYITPLVLTTFPNASYRFVLFFLLLILVSNVLAKIAYKYFEM